MARSKTASIEELGELHALIAKTLTKRILSGEATAADLNVARAFLKDSNVQAVGVTGSPIGDLAASLPFAGSDDETDYPVQ